MTPVFIETRQYGSGEVRTTQEVKWPENRALPRENDTIILNNEILNVIWIKYLIERGIVEGIVIVCE